MSVSEPGKIITPWAESGLKNPIPPAANPATGRAGFDQGFSAINMTAKEAGGIPPFGQDFNGIFYEVTNILRYMQAGGKPTFDAALATAIGGYPKGAVVLGSDGLTLWQSKVDSNSTDPNADPSAWGVVDVGLRPIFSGPDGNGLDNFYGGGGWTGGDAGSGSLLGSAHTNAMRWRYDVKGDPSLDPVIWVEKEIVSDANPVPGDTGWDGGAAYFDIKKTIGTSGSSALIGHARHNGGTGGLTAVQARGSGQHIDAQVWGVWAYADIGFGAELSGVEQAIAIEANNCNRGPDKGWMPGTGSGAARGVISTTADGTNRCTHAFYVGNQRATGGTPGTGGWWTGILVSANSIAANTNGTTSYVGDGEAMRINGSGQAAYSYGGLRFYTGSFKYGISFAEGGFNNNCAILMGLGKKINWGAHPGSSRHLDYDDVNNVLSVNNMGLAMTGVKVMGPRVTGIFNLSGTADGASKNTETVTLVELARYVKKVTDALITHGMIGPT